MPDSGVAECELKGLTMKKNGPVDVATLLGRDPKRGPKTRIDPRWRRHYERLLRLRSQLTGESRDLLDDSRQDAPASTSHMADAGQMEFDRELALNLLNNETDSLLEIDAAIRRIEAGNYGLCEATGKPIPEERLEAVPWTRYCAQAQAELEESRRRSKKG